MYKDKHFHQSLNNQRKRVREFEVPLLYVSRRDEVKFVSAYGSGDALMTVEDVWLLKSPENAEQVQGRGWI